MKRVIKNPQKVVSIEDTNYSSMYYGASINGERFAVGDIRNANPEYCLILNTMVITPLPRSSSFDDMIDILLDLKYEVYEFEHRFELLKWLNN